jgi:hypothetical protein
VQVIAVRIRTIRLQHRVFGAGLIAISGLALVAPLATGTWSLQFLSLFPLLVGVSDLYSAMADPGLRTRPASYATGALAIAAALLLFLSPLLVLNGVAVLLISFLVLDGVWKTTRAVLDLATLEAAEGHPDRCWISVTTSASASRPTSPNFSAVHMPRSVLRRIVVFRSSNPVI